MTARDKSGIEWTNEDGEPWAFGRFGHVDKSLVRSADLRNWLQDIDQDEFFSQDLKVEHLFVRRDDDQSGSWAEDVWTWCHSGDLGAEPVTVVRFQ